MELILSLSLEKRLLWLDVSFVRDRLTELRAELELEGFLSEQDFRMEGRNLSLEFCSLSRGLAGTHACWRFGSCTTGLTWRTYALGSPVIAPHDVFLVLER